MTDYADRIRAILARPFDGVDWRAHGNGFIKTYLDADKTVRLNIWHSCLLVPTSRLHNHPWGLQSVIIAGQLTNVRWVHDQMFGDDYMEGKINCAAFNGIEGEPREVYLLSQQPEVYTPGQSYTQEPDEIHHTEFTDGTITMMTRTPAPTTGGLASVFWPAGEEYGDASRSWERHDLVETISAARRQFEHSNAL